MENAKALIIFAVQGSMFLLILAIAMQSKWACVVDLLRSPRPLLRGVLAVNIVVPLVALLVSLAVKLDDPVEAGLLLMAVSPLAPLVPGNALKMGVDRSRMMAYYAVLAFLAIVFVPITVWLIATVRGGYAVAPIGLIAKVVAITILLPIVIGMAMQALAPDLSNKAARFVSLVATIILLVGFILIMFAIWKPILSLIGNGTIIAFAIPVLAGLVAGHLLGGPNWHRRGALAVTAAIRHPGIAGAIATANGAGPRAQAAILLFLLNGFILTTLYKVWYKRNQPAGTPDAVPV